MNQSFPPPNFVLTKSAIDGIEVYMPAPVESGPHQEVVNFNCPQCGATTAFSAADGGLNCAHCGYYEAPHQDVVGKKAQQFEFTVDTMERSTQGWGEGRKEMACEKCGALTSLPAESLTHTCPFCASNNVIQRQAPQDILRPRFLIPFKVEAEACHKIAEEWLGSSWMTPSNLRKIAKQSLFTGIYLPFWTFDAVTRAEWKAEVGHQVRKRYFENGQWKERTETVWRWESGMASLTIDDLVVPGTHRISNLLLDHIDDFNTNALAPYEPKFLAGLQAQSYDVPLEQAWDAGRQRMRERTRQACVDQASTSQVRNFSMNLDFSDESWRYFLLPVYLATYTYENMVYQVLVNAQTGKIAGQRPVDWNKIWLAIAALVAPGLLLGLLGILTIVFGGVGVVIGGFGFVLLVVGVVISVMIFQQANALDDA